MPFSDPESLALIARHEPDFFRHVERAREAIDRFELVFSGHESQKPIVSACLWYALDRGVTITISPRIVLGRVEPPSSKAASASSPKPENLSVTKLYRSAYKFGEDQARDSV